MRALSDRVRVKKAASIAMSVLLVASFVVVAIPAMQPQGNLTSAYADSVIATIPLGAGNGPSAVGVNTATNKIYVANFGPDTVTVIDGSDNSVLTTITGVTSNPFGVGVNPSTNRIYVSGDSGVSVINGATDTEIDLDTNDVDIDRIAVGAGPRGIGVNPVTNMVYVANSFSDTVSVINGATNTVVKTLTTGDGVGDEPFAIAVDPGLLAAGKFYVTNFTSESVSIFNGSGNVLITTISGMGGPQSIDVNTATHKVYVGNKNIDNVKVINGNTDSLVGPTISVGDAPRGVAVDHLLNRVYVASQSDDRVTLIDGSTDSVIQTITVGDNPISIAANAGTHRVYVPNNSSNDVSVIKAPERAVYPITIGGTTYYLGTPSETVIATFSTADGGDTVNSYSGYVLLEVSGVGNSYFSVKNDAFYRYSDGTDLDHQPAIPDNDVTGFYQLGFGNNHLVGSQSDLAARNFIVYDLDASGGAGSEVTAPYVPAYRVDHTYRFVVNTGAVSIKHFGVIDGTFDNVGNYTIEVTQLTLTPTSIPPPSGMIAWWPGDGNANDIVGSNDGTPNGATFVAGKVDQAFSFDGVDDFVTFGNTIGNFGTSDFTVDFWIKTSSDLIQGIMGKRPVCDTSQNFWDIRTTGPFHDPQPRGRIVVELNGDSTTNYNLLITTGTINDAVFHHVAIVRTGSTLSVYIDGVFDSSNITAGVTNIANSATVFAGKSTCQGIDGTVPFSGLLDEIEIFNRALTASEIQSIFNADSAGKSKVNPGDILVVDKNGGTGFNGALFSVNPSTGVRTLLSDFGNLGQGPTGIDPTDVAVETSGNILVIDNSAGTSSAGALFRVNPSTGSRVMLSDFGNSLQGPLGGNSYSVDVEDSGNILVTDYDAGTSFIGALFRVNPSTGQRVILSDFGVIGQGPEGAEPRGVAVEPSGDILVVDADAGTGPNGALFRVNPSTGQRVILSDFAVLSEGPQGAAPTGLAMSLDGSTIYVIDQALGPSSSGVLFSVDSSDGMRTILSDFSNGSQGPTGTDPLGIAVNANGNIHVVDPRNDSVPDGVLYSVNPSNGMRAVLSDFGDTGQGPTGIDPHGVAVVLATSAVNNPPVLDPIGDKEVQEEVLLTFTATANDPDLGQTLTFSLDDGVSGSIPAGASITTAGVFTWTPTAAQGPALYTFDVVVTDNGSSPLSDSETINVSVIERAQDYQVEEIEDANPAVQTFVAVIGLPDCIIDPLTNQCVTGQIQQTGTGTMIDARAGLVGVHFDTQASIDQQVILFKPTFTNFMDDPNPIAEQWTLKKDGVPLTLAHQTITGECDSVIIGDGANETCEFNMRVTRVLSVTEGATPIGTLEITYVFTNVLKHDITFTSEAGVTGTFTIEQAHQWEADVPAETVITAEGTEEGVEPPTLTEICSEANLIDLLIGKVNDLKDQGVLNGGNANALIKKLQNAQKSLDNGNTNAAINQINAFINQVNAFINAGKLTQQQGQELIDAANNIIQNINNPVQTTCTITDVLGGDQVQSLQFNDENGQIIVSESVESAGDSFIDATLTETSAVYEYGPFIIDLDNVSFNIDPSTATLSGATADGQSYTGSGTGTSCPSGLTKDTSSSLIRARVAASTESASSVTSPICARDYMQWDTTVISDSATVTDVDISFSISQNSAGSRSCLYVDIIGTSTTAPGSRSASTLYTDIGGTAYITASCSTTSLDLGSIADADLDGKLVNNWFGVGLRLSNDTVRGATTDFININSGNSSSKPVLTVVYTVP